MKHDDYLFDPAAPPDAAIEALERRLAPARLRDVAPLDPAALPPRAAGSAGAGVPSSWLRARGRPVAAAALALAAIAVGIVLHRQTNGAAPVYLERSEGVVRVRGGERAPGSALLAGDRIECEAGASARLRIGWIGHLDLEERTIVHVVGGHGDEESEGAIRLDLELGSVTASIFAAPRVFALGTPSAIAVDLGCRYRATVDGDGRTTLAVVSGRVSFESEGRRVYVPSGAACRAWPGLGPGTPVWDDAAAELRAAVDRHDEARGRGGADEARDALEVILTTDDPRDTLTLWHLLGVPEADLRGDVFDRLREFEPPPAGLTRESCVAPACDGGERSLLDEWREALEDSCW